MDTVMERLDSMDLFAERCKVEFGTIADVEDFQLMLSNNLRRTERFMGCCRMVELFLCPILQAVWYLEAMRMQGKAFVKTLLGKEAGASSNGISE